MASRDQAVEYNVGDRVESGQRGTGEYDIGTVTSVQRARGGERAEYQVSTSGQTITLGRK